MTGPTDLLTSLKPGWRGYKREYVKGKRCGVDGMTLLHALCSKHGAEYVKYNRYTNIIREMMRWILDLCEAVGPEGFVYVCFDGNVVPAKLGEQQKRHGPEALQEAWGKVYTAVHARQPLDEKSIRALSGRQ